MEAESSGEEAHLRWIDLWVAVALLTRLPVPALDDASARRSAHAVWAYPAVGAVVGALTGLTLIGLSALGVYPPISAAISLAVAAFATGALHEDGLADCADGIGGGWSVERRLEIMKDSSIGTYGMLALIFASLARWGALVAMTAWSPAVAVAAMVFAGAVSRAPLGAIMRWVPNARAGQGLSASVGRPPLASALLSLTLGCVAIPAAVVYAALSAGAVMAVFAALSAAATMAWIAWRKLGGQTGDVLGAAQVLAEVGALAALATLTT